MRDRLVKAMRQAGWPQRRIAEAVGCSRRHVSQRLRLLRLPEAVVEAISDGVLTLDSVPRVEAVAAVSVPGGRGHRGHHTGGRGVGRRAHRCRARRAHGAARRTPALVSLPGYLDFFDLLDADTEAELSARVAAAGVSGVHRTSEDLGAGRAYGCDPTLRPPSKFFMDGTRRVVDEMVGEAAEKQPVEGAAVRRRDQQVDAGPPGPAMWAYGGVTGPQPRAARAGRDPRRAP